MRGGGRFVDVNHNEEEVIEYILSKYSTYTHYTEEQAYFDYVSTEDVLLYEKQGVNEQGDAGQTQIESWLQFYDWGKIKAEMEHLAKGTASKDNVMKLLTAPVRLEFLTALSIKSKMPWVIVRSN